MPLADNDLIPLPTDPTLRRIVLFTIWHDTRMEQLRQLEIDHIVAMMRLCGERSDPMDQLDARRERRGWRLWRKGESAHA